MISKIVVGILLFAGFPFLGWGVTDVPGYLSDPFRMAYTIAVVILQIVIVMVDPEIGRQGSAGKITVGRQKLAILFLQILTLGMMIFPSFSDHRDIGVFPDLPLLRLIGLGIFITGFILMNWAEITLGKYFSIQVTVQEGHRLMTNGLYRRIRNPRYAGIILYNIGVVLIFRSWIALLCIILLVAVLIWRIRDEEVLMQKEFGEKWDAYQSRTKRLVPFVY